MNKGKKMRNRERQWEKTSHPYEFMRRCCLSMYDMCVCGPFSNVWEIIFKLKLNIFFSIKLP